MTEIFFSPASSGADYLVCAPVSIALPVSYWFILPCGAKLSVSLDANQAKALMTDSIHTNYFPNGPAINESGISRKSLNLTLSHTAPNNQHHELL